MERRKLKITLSLAVLIPCVLYIAGIIAQFMININAWKAAGSDYSVSPGLPSLELADVFRSIFHFPEGLIAIGVVVVGIVLICIFGLRIGWGQNGVTDADRNLTIVMPYEPSVTLNDLKQSDGSIGQVSIDRVGLNCKVYEGATDSSMSKGAGHYSSSGLYTGNVGLFGHNRGNHPYFGKLKNVKVGDIVKYKTAIGTKTYKVTFVGAISYTDFSYLNEMGDNRITLITCIANQPSLRLCVQAVEIR